MTKEQLKSRRTCAPGFSFLYHTNMKNASRIQHHPNQEDKTGRPLYASVTRLNYSVNDSREEDNVPAALESDPGDRILHKRKTKRKP
jgi:hypothetical protein